jgi:hypothetical protein
MLKSGLVKKNHNHLEPSRKNIAIRSRARLASKVPVLSDIVIASLMPPGVGLHDAFGPHAVDVPPRYPVG